MLWTLVVALVPVLAGIALGSVPRLAHAVVHGARPLAVVVTLLVVLADLLPHAWEGLGVAALGVLALGLALPLVVERVAGAVPGAAGLAHRAADELAFAVLLLHQLGDGLQVGASCAAGDWTVPAAVAVHSVPLVAVITLRYAADDHGVVWPRATALIAVTTVGAVLGRSLAAALPGHEGWMSALLGGLLLHVLWHDFPEHHHRD